MNKIYPHLEIQMLEKTVDGDTRLEMIALGAPQKILVGSLYLDNWLHEIPCVCWMYVREDWRKLHVAEKLLTYAIAHATNIGKTHLHSYVRKDNIDSLELHKKLGFSFCDNYHNADYQMQRSLDLPI